jgi:alkanesulfonate monooxygenase SsuD/methylene tetrahydromethanopterin reductase-like flavin-dependent oxidoreductase (luciferase family)
VSIRLGYQIPNFTYPDIPVERLFDTVVAQALEAESSGFDTVLVMDHFYQLPGIGAPRWSPGTTTATPRCWPRP